MSDNVASTVVLAPPTAPAAAIPTPAAVAASNQPTRVKPDLGLKADGTPRLRRMRGTGPARRAARPRPTATYFVIDAKTAVITKLDSEEATLEFLGAAPNSKDLTVIRGSQLATTMRVVLAEVK